MRVKLEQPEYDPDGPLVTNLVDADNGFNELNRKAGLWSVRHLWASGSRFCFNCYRHSATLVLQRRSRLVHKRQRRTFEPLIVNDKTTTTTSKSIIYRRSKREEGTIHQLSPHTIVTFSHITFFFPSSSSY